ncbi:Protein ABSCISIC ACID-INSENSITIVE 5 [Senna tora]|uniref:Protein ABSCISIC ACID-INSENSITIVE 5 n=1 Tax=Senna tora TaxID=362788 RepID=A0A834SNX8_9FABA|nr:Protein ABSCISIC ACID-INSENSITIVE 5 [Senna tora]
MGIAEGERKSQCENEKQTLSSMGRQSSIYSLTLDEFQSTLCDSGKNFGSMNMDEFLSSIWNAEENQGTNTNTNTRITESSTEIRKQPSLSRQGSLTLPSPLSRKTVEQVWSEIHRAHHNHQQAHNGHMNGGAASGDVPNTECAPRQPTFGEMTLEDFLVKAGVVRESCANSTSQYGMYANTNNNNDSVMGPTFGGNVVAPYRAVGEGRDHNHNNNGYPRAGVCYGAVSPDGLGRSEKCGVEMRSGRKRMMDGPVEKVVERRQRRMIKNRESAARSRARKQAYTVELEAELNQLREVNAHLKQALAQLERRRKQQCFEELNMRVHTKAQKAREKLRALRRNLSCPL